MIYETDGQRRAVFALQAGWPNSLKDVHESDLLVMVRTVAKQLASDEVPANPVGEGLVERVRLAVSQYREAPFRSADWLAGEMISILENAPANDIAPAVTQVDALPEEPSDAVIRAVDKAAHQHWPNARKMAVAMYGVIREAALKSADAASSQEQGASGEVAK